MLLSEFYLSVCLTSVCLFVAYIGHNSRTGGLGRLKLAQR